jgi:hypothetical protein
MKIKTKKVYYCDYCKKHSLRNLIEHEKHCTANPNRACKLCEISGLSNNIPELIEKYKKIVDEYKKHPTEIDQEKLLNELRTDTECCPNCILTIIRCSGLNSALAFYTYNYKEELKSFWEGCKEE